MDGLVVAILIVLLLLALVSVLPMRADLKPWAYVAIIVLLIIWLLRGGLPLGSLPDLLPMAGNPQSGGSG